MLEIKNIDVFYGDVQVIWDISFNVKEGEIVALIGANGAGKSTTLKTISGILRPRNGEILFNDIPIHKVEPYRLIELGIAHVPEARRLFVEMSVEENLDMGSLKGEAKKEREITKQLVFELFPRLLERRGQLAGTLSGGEQQMLAIGRALMSNPKLLLIDEMSLGLGPIVVQDLSRIIKEINRSKKLTIFLVEQDVQLALSLADKGFIIENGRIVGHGNCSELLCDDQVKEAYLGIGPVVGLNRQHQD